MNDLLDYSVTRLAPGNVANCQRFRIEMRIVDSATQQVEIKDWRQGSVEGSISFAFKTNVGFTDNEQRRALVKGIANLLVQLRLDNGDE
jgi:hypothetical protein